MSFDTTGYLLIYLLFSGVCFVWLRFFFPIKSKRFFLESFLANLGFLIAVNLGFLLAALTGVGLALQYTVGILFMLLVGLLARFTSRTHPQTKADFSLPEDKTSRLKTIYWVVIIFIMALGAFLIARQYMHPSFISDEIGYWVPRMKEIAAGNFSTTLNLGFASYPPMWMITGAHAMQVNSNFLYLLPVFLLIHLFLAIADFLYSLPGAKVSLIGYALLLPSLAAFFIGINTLQVYANFFVAILLSGAYFLDKYNETPGIRVLTTLFMVGAVLSRPDIVVFVSIWYLVSFIMNPVKKQRKFLVLSWMLIVFCFFAWAVYYRTQGISDDISSYTISGLSQLAADPQVIFTKIGGIISFVGMSVTPLGWLWYLPLYALAVIFIAGSKKWAWINLLCFSYLVFQYLTVPLDQTSTIGWWLGTGFFRMFGNFSLWIVLDLLVRVGSSGKGMSFSLEKKAG